MSTYSPSLRIELITTGTQAGTWGNTTNSNLSTVVDAAIAGNVSVAVAASSQALTYVDGPTSTAADNQAVRAILTLTTSTGAAFAVYAPPVSKLYTIYNNSSYTATIYNSTVIGNTTAAGTGVAIPAGETMSVWSDGTNFTQQNTALISPHLSGTPTAPTPSSSDDSTKIATTAFVKDQDYATLASPTFTGTPAAPTASAGTNTTQIATTAFVTTAVSAAAVSAYPVGSIYMNASDGTNPATLLGFGTWTALGAGRMLLGNGGGYSAGATGGSADAIVVSHTHTASVTDSGHTHQFYTNTSGSGTGDSTTAAYAGLSSASITRTPNTSSATTGISVSNSTTGSSGTGANMPPYLVVYMWQRTA